MPAKRKTPLESKELVPGPSLTARQWLFLTKCFALAGYMSHGQQDNVARILEELREEVKRMGGQVAYFQLRAALQEIMEQVDQSPEPVRLRRPG